MKINHLVSSILVTAGFVLAAGCATEKSQAELQAKAKISQAQAQQTALALVPNCAVKSSELEEERGKLVYSFDIATPGTPDITEVLVDAVTGKVVAMEKATPEKESKEKKEGKEKLNSASVPHFGVAVADAVCPLLPNRVEGNQEKRLLCYSQGGHHV